MVQQVETERFVANRRCCSLCLDRDHPSSRLRQLPAPHQKPKHKDQFGKVGDKEEFQMRSWEEVWLEIVDDPCRSIDYQQYANDLRDVAGPVNQVAHQNKVD